MAHFAKLDDNNLVLEVHIVNNNAINPLDEEKTGIDFLIEWSGGYTNWKQTSYNSTIRKNYAGVGYTYDEERDAFIPPKPFNSYILNEETCSWNPPIEYPSDGKIYYWNEETISWIEIEEPTE
jgi:hypothetical protein